MSKVLHEICVVVDRYTDREGATKNKYQKVGVELETNDGGRIILLSRWFNPAGIADPDNRGTVMLSLFEPKDGKEAQGSTQSARPIARTSGKPAAQADAGIPF